MPRKPAPKRVLHQPAPMSETRTLLDVYQGFTAGIYRMLKINPAWIQGFDEITALFSILGSVALFVISLQYTKPTYTDYVATRFNGSNFDTFGCGMTSPRDGVYIYGQGTPQFVIALEYHQFSLSALLSAAGRLQCEENLSFVLASPQIIDSEYQDLKILHPRQGAEILTNHVAFGRSPNHYYTFSAKGADLGLNSYLTDGPLLALLDVHCQKMVQQIREVLRSAPHEAFVITVFKTFGVAKSLLWAFAPLLGVVIAMNINLMHRYLRKPIIANALKFAVFRVLIGAAMFGIYSLLRLAAPLFGTDLENYMYSDSFCKSVICLSLALSGMFGAVLKQHNDTYAQEQAICSFLAFVVSLIVKPSAAGLFLTIAAHSVLAMYCKDMLQKKRITERDWTRNASFALVQLAVAYAMCYKHILLLQGEMKRGEFAYYLLSVVVVVQVLTGYSISVYSGTTGPLFLFSITFAAAFFFMQAACANASLNNIVDNIENRPKTSNVPPLAGELYMELFCNREKERCTYAAYGKTGEISAKLEGETQKIVLYGGKYSFELGGTEGDTVDRAGMRCRRARGETKTQILFRGIVDVWSCE